jgi:hypothetical protein
LLNNPKYKTNFPLSQLTKSIVVAVGGSASMFYKRFTRSKLSIAFCLLVAYRLYFGLDKIVLMTPYQYSDEHFLLFFGLFVLIFKANIPHDMIQGDNSLPF